MINLFYYKAKFDLRQNFYLDLGFTYPSDYIYNIAKYVYGDFVLNHKISLQLNNMYLKKSINNLIKIIKSLY